MEITAEESAPELINLSDTVYNATPADDSAPVSIALTENVYAADFEFRSTIRLVFDMIDSDSSEETVRTAVEIAKDAMGKDPVKLYGLIDILHDKIMSQWPWASSGAVNFYRVLFSQLDLDFLEDVGFACGRTSGTGIAVKHIIDKCMNEFDNHADWQSHNIACMLEFIDKSFQQGDNLVTAAATSNTVIKMAQSPYLFFDCYENLSIFREFSLLVVPRINKHDPDGMSKQLKEIFKKVRTRAEASLTQVLSIRELERNIGLIEKMPEEYNWANSEDYHKVIPTVLEDLEGEIKEVLSQKLFDDLYDWSCRAVNRLIDGVTDGMKMGAPPSTQLATCNMIEAMVRSNKLFLDDNLKKLSFFLHRIGPAIDGMADARQSDRLTTLLDLLRNNPEVRTPQHRNEIKSIRRNLGRTYEDLESAASKAEVDRDVEDQLSSLASKLGLDP